MQIQGQYAPSGSTWYHSAAAEETELVKTGGGLLFALVVANYNAAARYVFVFDSVTATGTPIVPPIPLDVAGTGGSIAALALPFAIAFNTGLFIAASTTGATYTASGGSDIRMSVLTK
jgi:hypothetical protein